MKQPLDAAQEATAEPRWDAYTGQNEAEGRLSSPRQKRRYSPFLSEL